MKTLTFLILAATFAALFLGAVACTTQETTIVGPDCHATASADGGGGGGGSATGEGGAGAPGGAKADSGCTGGSVSSK